MVCRVAIVGLGKIARDQHLPAIAATAGIELAAIVSRTASLPGIPCFERLDALLSADIAVDAVVLCTPPQESRPARPLRKSCRSSPRRPPPG